MNMKRHILTGMLILSVLSSQGCILLAGAALGGGSVAYKMGKLQHYLDEPLEDVQKATVQALGKLDWYVVTENTLFSTSNIEAQTIEGKKVKIDIEALTEKTSRISIRIGVVGDEQRSYMLLGAIQKQL